MVVALSLTLQRGGGFRVKSVRAGIMHISHTRRDTKMSASVCEARIGVGETLSLSALSSFRAAGGATTCDGNRVHTHPHHTRIIFLYTHRHTRYTFTRMTAHHQVRANKVERRAMINTLARTRIA